MSDTLIYLNKCLNAITENDNIKMNFHDICGITRFDRNLDKILAKYQIHSNPFCDRVKKTNDGLMRCIFAKDCAVKKAEKTKKPYYGYCYMGLGEVVYPVLFKDKLAAVIFIGEFADTADFQLSRLANGSESINLDYEEAKLLFNRVTAPLPLESLEEKINMFIKLFQLFLYESDYKFTDNLYENHLVESAVSFIESNYSGQLSLDMISRRCHCNPTYLSRVFKESTGTNISEYISRVRLERAKTALRFTCKSVTDIGYDTGFGDTAYFAKVFRKYTGMSPKEYRKYLEGKSVK